MTALVLDWLEDTVSAVKRRLQMNGQDSSCSLLITGQAKAQAKEEEEEEDDCFSSFCQPTRLTTCANHGKDISVCMTFRESVLRGKTLVCQG